MNFEGEEMENEEMEDEEIDFQVYVDIEMVFKGRYFKKAMKKAENELREKLEDSVIGVERLKIEANENRLSINASLNLMESNEDGAAYFCEDEFSFLREIPSADIETWNFRAESCY